MDAGDIETAIHSFQQSVELDPHFKTYELLGECLLKGNRPQEAILPLEAASRMNRSVRAVSLLAEAHFILGQHDKADHVADEALRRDTNNRKARAIKHEIAKQRSAS